MNASHGTSTIRGLGWAWQQVGEGPTEVVFIHGFQNDHTAWSSFIDGLSLDGRRITTVDLPGCGDSERPATWQRSTIDELALDLAELLRELAIEHPVLAGHSLGGGISLQLALDEPDTPSGLLLFAPVTTRGMDFVDDAAAEVLAHPTRDDQLNLMRAAFRHPPDATVLAALEATVLRADPAHIEGAARSMRTFDIAGRLGTIAAPALLVAGDRDRHVPLRHHVATWSDLRRAGLHVMHDVGHVPFVEDHATCVRLTEHFLDHERREP